MPDNPPKKRTNPQGPQNQPTPKKSAGATKSAGERSTSNRRFAERQSAKQQAARKAKQARNRTVAIGSIVLVAIIVIALVVVKVTGGGGASSASVSSPAAGTPVSAATISKLTSIPLSTLASAPTSGLDTSPQTISDPKLTADGKPELLYIGAEFCPYCAAERWAMYIALSKFGTFSPPPGQIHSAVRDGDIPTLTFYGTNYTSPYLTFTPVETTTNEPNGNSYVALQTPTAAQQKLWVAHTGGSFPWLDFGGKAQLTSSQYDPATLEGVSFDNIAADIGNNSTAIGANIDASAKVLIQTICSTMTDNKPADVCSAVGGNG